jgi:hypothetical protein
MQLRYMVRPCIKSYMYADYARGRWHLHRFGLFTLGAGALPLACLGAPFTAVFSSSFDRFVGGSSSSLKRCLVVFRRDGRWEDCILMSCSGDLEYTEVMGSPASRVLTLS